MSGIELAQFLATFFEEAAENLEILESGLLALEPEADTDTEQVNGVFRAAHTIKGGAASFGLEEIAHFTHHLETLLDEVRAGQRAVTGELVERLLEGNDCLREMLLAARAGEAPDPARVAAVQARLAALRETPTDPGGEGAVGEAFLDERPAGWRIRFVPHPPLMHTGNDPLRILEELQELGALSAEVDLARLPAWSELHPEDCYLAWDLSLRAPVPRERIEEAFLWVEGECDLELLPLVDNPTRAAEGAETARSVQPDQSSSTLSQPPAADARAVAGEVIIERRKSSDRRQNPGRRKGDRSDASSIRVGIDKIDTVINRVGELITTQSMLSNLSGQLDPRNPESFRALVDQLREAVDHLEHHTRELQDDVMAMRMLPISFVFSRFGRTVHDLCNRLEKKVELHLGGEQTELDKTVIEKIADPLMHLVRNSMDHGFEPPRERLARNKPETGVLLLNAFHKGGSVYIEIRDDGRGLDPERLKAKAREKGLITPEQAAQMSDQEAFGLIMLAGFSTAEAISEVSGRGVGMDVVRKNIEELKGEILIDSIPGSGTTVTIRLPLTLAILEGQLVAVGEETYVVPLVSIIESIQVCPDAVHRMAGRGEVVRYRDDYLPIVRLHQVFQTNSRYQELEEGILVILEVDGSRFGVFVDDLLGQQQVAIKSLETNLHAVEGMMGATILGDGRVALILDPPGLSRLDRVALP